MSTNSSFSKICKVLTVFLIAGILISSTGRKMLAVFAQPAQTVSIGEPGLSFRYVQTIGETGVPYLADGKHLNKPNGLFIDPANNLYVTEEHGHRLLKFDSAGTNTMIIGHAGQPWAHDDFLAVPVDVALDSSANIWVVFNNAALKEFDSAGNVIQTFPATNPWEQGDANDRFRTPWGIAFDSSGYMYVSDQGNHRIQVYDVSGETPSYVETIGETGVPHSDNNGFDVPGKIAFDSLGRLYVMDSINNFRIQRCTKSGTWSCETFFGETGVQGNDMSHLSWAFGITIKNDIVYIADGANYRILTCTLAAVCTQFAGETGVPGADNSHFRWISDVAVDSLGNVYVSDLGNYRIQKFNSSGTYLKTIGTKGVPYLTDTKHINHPWGLTVNSAGDLYVVEHLGYRLLKFNSAGVQQWTVGKPGVDDGSGGKMGGGYLAGPEGNPAIDATGRIYVSDTQNHRIRIYNSDGTFFKILGTGWGQGNYEFACPTGIAVSPINGDIYIVDHCNQRIQVFTASRIYKATLGETGVEGDDDAHFRWPWGVAVANNGNIFVADSENHRVQKCNFTSGANYTCSTLAGETGTPPDGSFNYIHPLSVAVDTIGRVYVADEWDGRIMVYDSAGSYLTSIGNNFSGPSGVAVDKKGNVYVSDRDNHRIQKFSPGVPGWKQVNINGFGDKNNWAVSRMSVFNGYLYASTGNINTGGEVWRTEDGHSWTQINSDGFGDPSNTWAGLGEAFNGYLYASTNNTDTGAQIWRCAVCDGTDWMQVVSNGLGDSNNFQPERVVVFSNAIYAAVDNSITGVEVWKSTTGDSGSWTQANTDGFGDAKNTGLWGVTVFNGYLYAATAQWDAFNDGGTQTGLEVWRTNDGVNWNQVNIDGFGDVSNFSPWLESFNGHLYVLSTNYGTGAQIWRCAACDGSDWQQVVNNGFGDNNNIGGGFMFGFGGYFYAGTSNDITGTEVWRTTNGTTWSKVNTDGFGDRNNVDVWSGAVFKESLYLGTRNGWQNSANSGQVWLWLSPEVMNINTITDTGDGTLSDGEQVIVPVTKLTVTFNKDIKKPTVSQFTLKKGTTLISINSVSYDSLTKTVTLNINGGKKLPFGTYSLIINKSITATDKNRMAANFVHHFTIVKPPTVPSLIAPANKAVVNTLQPKLDWSNSSFPVGTAFDHYQLQLATEVTFTGPIEQNTGISEFTLLAPLTGGTKYFWRVRAYNTLGQASAWSAVFSFATP